MCGLVSSGGKISSTDRKSPPHFDAKPMPLLCCLQRTIKCPVDVDRVWEDNSLKGQSVPIGRSVQRIDRKKTVKLQVRHSKRLNVSSKNKIPRSIAYVSDVSRSCQPQVSVNLGKVTGSCFIRGKSLSMVIIKYLHQDSLTRLTRLAQIRPISPITNPCPAILSRKGRFSSFL